MTQQWKSVLTGAAVAALVTLPAFGADGWITIPVHTYDVHSIKVDSIVGHLTIDVKSGPTTFQASGTAQRIHDLTFKAAGDTLYVEGTGSSTSVWDWRHWFDFSTHNQSRADLSVHITVPRGADVDVDNLVGDADIGDTMGPLKFSAISTDSKIGRVGDAKLSLAGSGRIVAGDIDGDLHVETAGSGKIKTGNAQDVHADVAGAGAIQVGEIRSLHLDIAGSGDFVAVKVNGPTHVSIAGSGSVAIAKGEANPLHVDIMGSGNFNFGGTAVDPHVSALGSGNVTLGAIRGKLSSDGMANVRVENSVPPPPAPPAPPRPPAPMHDPD